MIAKNARLMLILGTALSLLFIPLIAMQYTPEVDWKPSDFLIMASLLAGTSLACEFILRKFRKRRQRLFICAIVVAAFLLTWAELAVGVFGTPFAGS